MDTKPAFIGQVEDRLAGFMRQHHRTMHRYFCSIGMVKGHPHMLFHLGRCPGITQKELAHRLHISPPSVATSVRRMEAAGLVRREGDEKDGRVTHLYLTPEGEEMDAACARGREFMMDALYQGLSAQELDTLYALLGKMTANLQSAAETLPEIPQDKSNGTMSIDE